MQNDKCFRQFAKGRYRHRNYFLRLLAGVLVFVIATSLYYVSASASEESGLCEQNIVVTWSWDSDELAWDDSTGQWRLGLPGANEGNPATRELLKELLPREIKATMGDGSEKELTLSWELGGFPKEGAFEGSYILSAALPGDYVLGKDAQTLKVLAELGGGETYADGDPIDKYVNDWSYVSRGGSAIKEDSEYKYSMDYYLAITSDRDTLIQKMKSVLPSRIYGSGYNSENKLVEAGFIPEESSPGSGIIKGYVEIKWDNIEQVIEGAINKAGGIKDNMTLAFEAEPVSNEGYRLRVNSNNTLLNGDFNDTAEIDGILNLTVTLHDLHLEDHIVSSANPPSTTVNLFDYWVDKNGAAGNDLLRPQTDWSHNGSGGQKRGHTGVDNWDKGINKGRLLLFGDGNIHAGFWNKGAGSSSAYGKKAAGMPGIVKSVLESGYPVINEDGMNGQIDGYQGISDWDLCGEHADDKLTSENPKNISDTVINKWKDSGNDASLDYLFDPGINLDNKNSHKDVKGLFQIDSNGYYYYDMRQNFAEYNKDSNRFVLYDAPAVDRTDKAEPGDDSDGDTTDDTTAAGNRSVGNFFPFNTGAQVFDLVENGKLSGNHNISSHNERTTAGYMNHHLGMTVDVEFRQPLNGVINTGATNNTPMTFQFSGDDDVWIFIDDVLVLDLGGVHSEIYGVIDFSTGNVAVGQSWKTNGFKYKADGTVDVSKLPEPVEQTTLKERFEKAGKAGDTLWKGDTFASDTSHTLKMFYLERGNYDSSLALRFNLQPLLYQQLRKVDQNGNPLGGVEFDLCPAEETTAGTSGAIKCQYTDEDVNDGKEFYVKKKAGSAYVHLTTAADGTARFLDEYGNYFNFADQGRQYYILKETKTPNGYRSLPVDIVLYYDPDISMLSVANRWSTGAYACSVVHNTGTGKMTYGHFDAQTGGLVPDPSKMVSSNRQSDGLVVAIPMLLRDSDHTWEALYGSNLNGFSASAIDANAGAEAWGKAVLRAVLEQAADSSDPNWNLTWDSENSRLIGTLDDLPGVASRYRIVDPDGDMQIIYGIIEPEALQKLGITGKDAEARYAALGEYIKKNGTEKTLEAIMGVTVNNTGSGKGFSFLNTSQLSRTFRSLIYIPNEQRELWVMKVDQDGRPRDGARFGLYGNAQCTGSPVAQGITATVNGQAGTLIFSPSGDQSAGHARMMWESYKRTRYYLKELSAPDGCNLNPTIVPVVVGNHSIYADAGKKTDGVTVMAGVGRLTQTMRQYAMDEDVDITLRDITAVQQHQPSENEEVLAEDWKDTVLEGTADVKCSLNLHFGKNAVVDYGLHDEDGGKLYKPYFVSDAGYVRARVVQNYEALTTPVYEDSKLDANKDDLGDTDLTDLFSLLNIVVVTDRTTRDTNTGKLMISKTLMGSGNDKDDYTKNFSFTIRLTDKNGRELGGDYYFYGTDKSGYISSGETFPLHHDERITILGLPAGTKYTVTEMSVPGWYPLPATGTIDGSIVKDATSFATFYNSKEPWPEIGFLILHKTVAGDGDREKGFTFTVTLTDAEGVPLEEEFSYAGDKKGKISSGQSITLSHDQYITIYGLPVGVQYTVSEKEADKDGYTTSAYGEAGIIANREIHTAAFTNTVETVKPPGENEEPDPGGSIGTEPDPDPGTGSRTDDAAKKSGRSGKEARGLDIPKTGDPLALLGIVGMMSLSGAGIAVTASKRQTKRHRGRLLQLRRKKLMRQRRRRFVERINRAFRKKHRKRLHKRYR